jgi:hypothetical protein
VWGFATFTWWCFPVLFFPPPCSQFFFFSFFCVPRPFSAGVIFFPLLAMNLFHLCQKNKIKNFTFQTRVGV